MKKTLFWYIAKEVLLYFFVCFLFFFLVFFVNQILLMAEDILSKKAPFKDVAMLIVYALPSILATSAPFASLVGTLMCIGRFVSEREILAMSALGVSIRFILVPVLCVGIFISMISFFTNDILLPAGTIQFTKLYRKILTSTPALELESNSIKRNQNAVVVSGTIHDNVIDSVLVIDSDGDGNNRIISSSGARIMKSTSPAVVMTLALDSPKILIISRKESGSYDSIVAKTMAYNILAKSVLSAYGTSVSPREMSSRDLYAVLKKKDFAGDARAANMYKMEFQKKFSIPFGAFFFVILAFPLGLLSKSNGQSVGFILGLIISVFYWAMLIGGQMLSLQLGLYGSLIMWIPNILVFGVGSALIFRSLSR